MNIKVPQPNGLEVKVDPPPVLQKAHEPVPSGHKGGEADPLSALLGGVYDRILHMPSEEYDQHVKKFFDSIGMSQHKDPNTQV